MSVKQAQDAMMANATISPTGNIDAMREGFFDTCRQFGEKAGAGDTSKVGWFQAIVEAAWQGHIVPSGRKKPGDPPGDAETAYRAFAEARQKKAGEMGKRIAGPDAKGSNVRISEANRMISLGSLPIIHDIDNGGLGVFNKTLRIIRDNEEIVGQVDDLLLEVARRQCEKPDVVLTDEQIKDMLTPEGPVEKQPKTEVELWGLVLAQVESIMNKKFPETAGVDPMAKQARNSVLNRFEALGGKTAEVKAREKKEEADAKKKGKTPEQQQRVVQRQGASKKAAAKKKKL